MTGLVISVPGDALWWSALDGGYGNRSAVKALSVALHLWEPDFRLQTSDFRLQTSDFRLRSTKQPRVCVLQFFISYDFSFRLQTSDFEETDHACIA